MVDSEADIGLAWLRAAPCARRPPGSFLDFWDCPSSARQLWHAAGQRNIELCRVFTACCRAVGDREGIIQGGGLGGGGGTLPHLSDGPRASSLSLRSYRLPYLHRDLGIMEGCVGVALRLSCLNHSSIYPLVSQTLLPLSVTAARSTVG